MMKATLPSVKKIIEKGESESLEFKKSTAQLEKALKSICAFSNHKGGVIYFGIDNGKVVGQEVSDNTMITISQKIRQRIKPEVTPEVRVLETEGKKVIEVKVKEGNNKPYYLNGIAYKRVGTENPVISPEELERIILEKRKRYWDSEICEGANLDDIDEEKVKRFLRKAKYERNFDVESKNAEEALERLELIKNDNLTNASILLFGKNPQKFFLQARIRCARFKGTTAVDFIDMKLIDGDIIDQVEKAENFVLSHIKKAAKIVMFAREEVWEYPPDALREAIVNAVCHRDYSISGNIKIAIFDDRIEISNPGQLPEPLTPPMLKKKHDSILRNPLIANSFFLIKNIEQWGKGTNKIIQWCVEHGLKEPDFEEIGGGFEVVFYAPEDILKLIPEKGRTNLKELGLNERQIEALKLMVNENQNLNNQKYRELFRVSTRTASRELSFLVEKGLIRRLGKRRGATYVSK
ncbi:MAG: hypothetical protein DRN08_06585 [Thermoplasmata archaeon]|nr:MAG: hypothetical protein DRN08_06585 [Thermoplasmata archaeon]